MRRGGYQSRAAAEDLDKMKELAGSYEASFTPP